MMVIRLRKLTVFLVIMIFIVSGCSSSSMTKGQYKNKYAIDVYYNPAGFSIYGSQKLMYKNTEDRELKDIYFHMYPNAFRDKETAPMTESIEENYPGGFNSGQVDIIGVWTRNNPLRWNLIGDANTILQVKLNEALKINENIEIRIDFQEKLPNARTDFGSYNGIACFENWYPVLCVYDSSGWHLEPYSKFGEPNFSEISDYEVNINLPEDEVVASTGKITRERSIGGGRKHITIKANNVRDFAWFSSSHFNRVEKKHNGVTIKSYYIDRDKVKGITALDICTRALDFFSETFGPYPYDTFSIAETYLKGGAMEYPMLASIGMDYYTSDDDKLIEGVIAHELAHQWWYVVVGNNEYQEPWLDEAFAEYSEIMYFEKYYGSRILKDKVDIKVVMAAHERDPGDSMSQFRTSNEYNLVVYNKGAYILHELRENIGDQNFLQIMKSYYDCYKFKNADIEGFLQIVNEVCGSEAVKFINIRLSGK